MAAVVVRPKSVSCRFSTARGGGRCDRRRVIRVKVGDRIAGTFHPRWFGGPIRPKYLTDRLGANLGWMLADAGSARASKLIGSKVYAGDTSIGVRRVERGGDRARAEPLVL
jgi:hypothetical protein